MTDILRRLSLAMTFALLAVAVAEVSIAHSQEEIPGRCEPNYCGFEPPGSCGSTCKVHGSGEFCITNFPNVCG